MEELTHDFLSFLPAALLTLAAAGAPEVYKLAARRFLDRAKSHMASWLYILLDSFLTPVAGLFRVLLGAAAVKSLPFELVRDAVFLPESGCRPAGHLLYLARLLACGPGHPAFAAQRPEPSGFRNKSDDGTLF